jgi:hypothetical protein
MSIVLIAAVVMIKGKVSGREFAPSHFETREFTFYEIPLFHLQITPIGRKNTTGPLERQLRANGWITVPRGQNATDWHLVTLWRGPIGGDAVASLLTRELQLRGPSGPFWPSWNSDYPQRASKLWPTVQRLASRELYLLIPEMLQIVRSLPGDDDATTTAALIDQWLIAQYTGLIRDLRDAGRNRLADELLGEAIGDYPRSPELGELIDGDR